MRFKKVLLIGLLVVVAIGLLIYQFLILYDREDEIVENITYVGETRNGTRLSSVMINMINGGHAQDIDSGFIDNTMLIDVFSKTAVEMLSGSGALQAGRLVDGWNNDIFIWISSDRNVIAIASMGPNERWDDGTKDDIIDWEYADSGVLEVSEEDKFPLIFPVEND